MPGTRFDGAMATCSVSWKKLSTLRFSTIWPILRSGMPGQILVASSGSKSNFARSSGLSTWMYRSHFGKSPFRIALTRSLVMWL